MEISASTDVLLLLMQYAFVSISFAYVHSTHEKWDAIKISNLGIRALMFVLLYYSTNTTQQLVAALFNQPNYYILCA